MRRRQQPGDRGGADQTDDGQCAGGDCNRRMDTFAALDIFHDISFNVLPADIGFPT
jgi:hypothetical protein